ncbi:MAG: hypothetical protein ACR2NG_02590, partial [Acidimicrobiia bacterium]
LRQRLLLVAGWIAAAVGAGVVASGAVAVAGGQVLDQPLRPLTAAEVAALPVVEAGEPDVFEPQASGGFVSTTGEPAQGSQDSAPDPAGPAGTGGSTASDYQETPPDPLAIAPAPAVELVRVEGGQASFVLDDQSLYLLWATPRPGYVVSSRGGEDNNLVVAFSSARGAWRIEATVVAGELVVTSGPEPLT